MCRSSRRQRDNASRKRAMRPGACITGCFRLAERKGAIMHGGNPIIAGAILVF
jgi:hypothetical protein